MHQQEAIASTSTPPSHRYTARVQQKRRKRDVIDLNKLF